MRYCDYTVVCPFLTKPFRLSSLNALSYIPKQNENGGIRLTESSREERDLRSSSREERDLVERSEGQ
jgi:hypothetical protein